MCKVLTLTCLIVIIDFDYGWFQVCYCNILQNLEGQTQCLACHLESKRELNDLPGQLSSLSSLNDFKYSSVWGKKTYQLPGSLNCAENSQSG